MLSLMYVIRVDLVFLNTMLDNFKKLSGLEINAEKTLILPINCLDTLKLDISHLGFKFISSMPILGYQVSDYQNMSEINFK